ncbi:MAG: FAD-binding protein [Dehalobacter sp.]|nr:FAD-binding protein [Dehalobacter sp.]
MKTTEYTSDIIVVGGGIAGLYAANSAALNYPDAKITLLTADELGSGGCSKKTHGINAAMNKNDSCEAHISDTIAGGIVNNSTLVKILCEGVIDRINELETWGVRFDRDENGFCVGTYGGSSCSRSVHWYDITGLEIVQELVKRSILNGCFIKEHRWVVDLIIDHSECYGVIAFNRETNTIETYRSTATILATGGGACVYPISSISQDKLATGIMIGLNSGVPLIDMEMVQFHPTGVIIPGSPGNGCLLEEEMRTQGGILRNSDGERYMYNYDSRGELATRDIVARSSYMEILSGRGTNNNGVIFDISMLNRLMLKNRFPKTVKRLRSWGVDLLTVNKVEISPTAHFLMGGLMINSVCETPISGLFACGEDAGGIHGGNRLGGNGVAEALVFGHLAGMSAGRMADYTRKPLSNGEGKKIIEFYDVPSKEYSEIDFKIKTLMWSKVGLVRDGVQLNLALHSLNEIQHDLKGRVSTIKTSDRTYSEATIQGLILKHKLELAIAITTSALSRKDSVGAHYRSDTGQCNCKYNIILKKDEGQIQTSLVPHVEPASSKIG